jgi:hypothetical protein
MQFISIPSFDLLTVNAILQFFKLPVLFYHTKPCELQITFICVAQVMLGCWVACSNSFPKTPKSAKYAGNWDPKLKSLGRINCNNGFSNFLTRNMKVLVYGVWDGQSSKYLSFYGELF